MKERIKGAFTKKKIFHFLKMAEQAFFFHKKAMELKPEDPGVLYDQKYFREKYGLS